MVGINEAMVSTPEAPFGGVKESGLGKEVIIFRVVNNQGCILSKISKTYKGFRIIFIYIYFRDQSTEWTSIQS